MAPKARPYDQFGPYILFKKLEADSLGELWRAAKIVAPNELGPAVALRRLSGGDRAALTQSAAEAAAIVPLLHGTTFVKGQTIEAIESVPAVSFDYAIGRSLRHIVDRARGGTNATPNPIPIDLAILIAERLALSLATTSDLRHGTDRLTHGALIPQFVWITDDGEVRVAGQQLGRGLIASLRDANVNGELGRYFSPELRTSGVATKSSEVYALGAMLFLLVTGVEPPDPLSVTAFTQNVRAAKTMTGQPIPLEIRQVLDQSLILDPASRYPSAGDMKQALDVVAAKFSSTTFSLAFYVSTLLKKELEAETAEREKESKVNITAYTTVHAEAPTFESAVRRQPGKSGTPLIAAAVIAGVAIAVAAAYFAMKPSAAASSQRAASATSPPLISQPIVASTSGLPATTATVDPNAAKRAFEDAVNQKLQQEMLRLQSDFNRKLQQAKSRNAPVATEVLPVQVAQARPAPPAEEPAPSAAALDERRLNARQEAATTQTTAPAPAPAVIQPQPQPAAPEAAPVQVTVHEGDVIDASDLDTVPKATRMPVVAYPAPAQRMRIETSVIVTVLVSENGDVLDVKMLRGDPRFGFNDSAMRAVRNMKFSSPVKDGKRVKTWFPQTINFKL